VALALSQASKLSSFYQAESARAIHCAKTKHFINRTLQAELNLIHVVLCDDTIPTACPISHLIICTLGGVAFSDSSVLAAGGYSPDLKFWWYHEWPRSVHERTLHVVKNNTNGTLIDINVLEYATLIINYLVGYHALSPHTSATSAATATTDPHPVVLLHSDNSSSEAWARKGAQISFAGRALERLHVVLLICNPMGICISHILTSENVTADTLSHIPSKSSLLTTFPPLGSDPKGAQWLSWIPTECRANLMHYECSIAGCLHRSHRTKQAVTDGSWKNHFLAWCSHIWL
jgi:hypothetical protein